MFQKNKQLDKIKLEHIFEYFDGNSYKADIPFQNTEDDEN